MSRNASDPPSDDLSEMTADDDFTDRDLDALLSGRDVRDSRLTGLVPAMAALRASAAAEPSDEQATSMALALSRAVPVTTAVQGADAKARRSPLRTGALSRRFAAVVAGAGLLGVGFVGAAAADGAAPGDFLYGLDRALEAVGVNNGGAHERLLEVRALLDAGDLDGALLHAEQATDELDPQATETLRMAAAAIADADSDQLSEVREQVSAMLTWMTATELKGEEFGQGVAAFARTIAEQGKPSRGEASPSSSPGSQAPVPADRPGTGGKPTVVEPGKPAAPGGSNSSTGAADPSRSGNAGSPPSAGKPAEPGTGVKPASPAPPADAGSSDNAGKPDQAGTPGKPNQAGTPGKPDHAGTPGKPDHAGTPGKPDHAGGSANQGNSGGSKSDQAEDKGRGNGGGRP